MGYRPHPPIVFVARVFGLEGRFVIEDPNQLLSPDKDMAEKCLTFIGSDAVIIYTLE
jgi:hypothetical protein